MWVEIQSQTRRPSAAKRKSQSLLLSPLDSSTRFYFHGFVHECSAAKWRVVTLLKHEVIGSQARLLKAMRSAASERRNL